MSPTDVCGKLMPEMPGAGEYHGDPVIVRRLDHLAIAHRAARLDHGGSAGFDRDQKPVSERKERVGRYNGSVTERRPETGVVRGVRGLARPNTSRIDPAHLAGPDPDRGAVLGIHNSVRFHVLGNPKSEPQVG